MVKIIQPDSEDKNYREDSFKVFFAGTIDNGDSEDWQKSLYSCLVMNDISRTFPSEYKQDELYITIFNPRRNNWPKDITDEEVIKQIKWEQEKLDEAHLIIIYLADNSKSPISLLELGLYGQTGKVIVYCTDKFYRYNNVKLTCDKYLIEHHDILDEYQISQRIIEIYTKEFEGKALYYN